MKSISKKVTLNTVVTVIFALLILGFSSITSSYLSTLNLVNKSLSETAVIAAERVRWELDALSNTVKEIGCNSQLADPKVSDDVKNQIIERSAANFGFLRGSVINADGKAINGNDYSDRAYFKAALEGKTTITEPMVARTTGKVSIIVAAPLWENGVSDSKVVGCVFFVPEEQILNDIVRTLKISENGSAYIIDKNGTTIADIDSANVENGVNVQAMSSDNPDVAALAEVHEKMTKGENGFADCTFYGTRRFIGYASIADSNGWSIAVYSPASDFLQDTMNGIIIMVCCLVAALVISSIWSFIFGKQIGKPIKLCTERINKLADGDLTSAVPEIKTKDETGVLAQSTETLVNGLNRMNGDIGNILGSMADGNFDVQSEDAQGIYRGDFAVLIEAVRVINSKLSDTLSQISIAGDQVSGTSEQVSSGSQALAQGATEQAASVEELANSIHNISNHVQATTRNCEEGKKLVDQTAEYFEKANDQMKRLSDAMKDISDASDEISNIIKTIEDIAFQTNILALNAAVEAARVGEAGKGFAVVADEVRNLASKSADAAHDTTVLIERALAAVENGTTITADTAATVAGVEERAAGVMKIVGEITAASELQTEMISQVNIGVEQISSVVQTNSATAEESAAASQELSAQAQMLKKLVSQFTLRDE